MSARRLCALSRVSAPRPSFPMSTLSLSLEDERTTRRRPRPLGSRRRDFSSSALVGLVSAAGVAYGVSMIIDAVNKPSEKKKEITDGSEKAAAGGDAGSGEPPFGGFFEWLTAKNFYEGGFEEKMTRREAALVLGVREHHSKKKIRDAHRRMALINHPDRQGSPYLQQKINQAKDVLMGARD